MPQLADQNGAARSADHDGSNGSSKPASDGQPRAAGAAHTARPRVFLSYGRGDATPLAARIRDELENFRFDVWRDVESIRAGHAWDQEIFEGIRQSDVVVAILTPHAVRRRGDPENTADNRDSVCLDEIGQARFGDPPRPVIPVRGIPCPIPFPLFRFHYVDLCGWEQNDELYRAGIRQLVQSIEDSLHGGPPRQWWDDELRPFDFSAFLYEKRRDFCGREWLFREIDEWSAKHATERALLVTGNPGAGKSAIVAELVNRDEDARIIGYHCCQADAEQTLEPWRFIRSLAAMIASRLDPFAEALRTPRVKAALSEASCKDDPIGAFETGILGPLDTIHPGDDLVRYLLVDGLDEALAQRAGGFTIVSLLATRVERLPHWLRLVATTRKDPAVLSRVQGLRARELDAQDPRNLKDVESYVARRLESPALLEHLTRAGTTPAAVASRLLERSEGNFLYVRQALDGIARREFRPDRLDDLPPGLFGFYQGFFARQFPDAASYAPARKVLEIVTAAQEPLSPEQLAQATRLEEKTELPDVLRQLSVYLPNRPDADGRPFYAVFHKSLADWLTAPELRGSLYAIDRVVGHETLAELCWAQYAQGVGSLSRYALAHLPAHLAAAGRWERLEELLTDLRFLEEKTNAGMVVDLMMDLRRSVEAMPAGRSHRRMLRLLGEAIHRDMAFLSRHPSTLFQCLWNQCWWYDCPEAAQHYDDPRAKRLATAGEPKPRTWAGTLLHASDTWRASAGDTVAETGRRPGSDRSDAPAERNVPWYRRGTKLYEILERWRREKEDSLPDFCWVRSLRPPPIPLGTGLLAVLNSHEGSVNDVAVSADGSRLASVSEDGALCLWNPDRGQLLARIVPPRTRPAPRPPVEARGAEAPPTPAGPILPVRSIEAPPPPGARWTSFTAPAEARPVPPLRVPEPGIEQTVQTIVFRDPGRQVANAATLSAVAPPQAPAPAAASPEAARPAAGLTADIPPPPQPMAPAENPSIVTVPRPEPVPAPAGAVRGTFVSTYAARHSIVPVETTRPALERVAFSPEGRWVVCAGRDGVVRVVNVDDVKDARVLEPAHRTPVVGLAWLASDRFLTLSVDGQVHLWSAPDFERVDWALDSPPLVPSCVVVVPETRRVLIGCETGEVVACDTASSRVSTVHREDVSVQSIDVSPNGRRIACGLKSGRIAIVDLLGGQVEMRLAGHSEAVRSVAWSPNGRQIVSGSSDGTVRLWDATSGEPLVCQRVQDFGVNRVAWLPDNRRFVSAAAAEKDESLDEDAAQAPLAFPVAVWDAEGARTSAQEGGDLILHLRGHQRMVDTLAYSPDGERLVTAGADRTLRIWDARNGAELRCLHAHDRFQSVAWSPDARILSATTADGMFGVWDVEAGRQLFFLYGPDFAPGTVAHLQENQRIVYGRIAGGRAHFFWKAEGVAANQETIVRAVNDEIVAGLPLALRRIGQHPSGRIWAGAAGNHVFAFALEGATRDEPRAYEPETPPRIDAPIDAPTDAIIVKWKDFEYVEEQKLGEGGMGVVFEARQTSTNRRVAVKTLKRNARKDQELWRRFFIEAVITSRLDHPNIVPIYDLGIDETGRLFYSMKRIRGVPWLKEVRVRSLSENLDVLLRVCDAVEYAHSLGVVHRDLKPENVMLGDFGEVLLVDWGLAITLGAFPGARHFAQRASMGGTPAYMAPEMATGPVTKIGPCSDVYLLGAILFEIVAGHPPHTGSSVMKCLMAAAKNDIRPTDKSGELVDIALRAMATNPNDRFESVAALKAALRSYRIHSESHLLADRAHDELRRARDAGDYQSFTRALFGFREALELWPDNERAKAGRDEAALAHAERALANGDLDVAASVLDAANPRHAPLLARLELDRKDRGGVSWLNRGVRWIGSRARPRR